MRTSSLPKLRRPRILAGLLVVLFSLASFGDPAAYALTQDQLNSIINNTPFYDSTQTQCTYSSASSNLDNYSLPASSGKTGQEQPIDDQGKVIGGPDNGRPVTFASLAASLSQSYRDYYIAMRWEYTAWNWSGTSVGTDSAQLAWMGAKPRLILVTNNRNGNSIVATALEAGPAPWTGVDNNPNNTPKEGWTNPQKGAPSGYTGRVSGLAPKAIQALDAQMGIADGTGDVLTYSWAADQNTTPGPITTQTTGDTNLCPSSGGGLGNVVFYSQRDKRWANTPMPYSCGDNINTIGDCGCYLTAQSMIVSTLTGRAVHPDQIYKLAGGHSDVNGIASSFNLKVKPYLISQLPQALSQVKPDQLLLIHGHNGDPFYGTPTHWEVVRQATNDNKFYVDDPWDIPDLTNDAIPSKVVGRIVYNGSVEFTFAHSYTAWPISDLYANLYEEDGPGSAIYLYTK